MIFNGSTGGTITVSPGMLLLSTTVSGGSSYAFTGGPISGGTLANNGPGRLTLSTTPANFTSTTVNGGTLYLKAGDGGFGTSPINMNNVTINNGAWLKSHQMSATGNLTLNGGTYDDDSGWSGTWAGTIYLAADSILRQDGFGALSIPATISGPGGLTSWENGGFGLGVDLSGVNDYTGPTIVSGGHLTCENPAALGNGGALTIESGAYIALNYTGDHVVSALTFGGAAKAAGSYGSSSSPATFKNDTYFHGRGTVTVPGVEPPLITSFGLPGNPANIDQTATTITWSVPQGSDVTHLAPTYTVSAGTGAPASGSTHDFTSPVTYEIVNGTATNHYVVTVKVVPPQPVLDGLALWLDASNTNTMTFNPGNHGAVTQWRDQYGGPIAMGSIDPYGNQGSPAWVESSGIGGKPAVSLIGGTGATSMQDHFNHQPPVTVIYVGRMTGGTSDFLLCASDNWWELGYHGGNMAFAEYGGWLTGEGVPADTNPHLFAATIPGPGQDSAFYMDAALVIANQNGTEGPNNLTIRAKGIWSNGSDCQVAEVLVYNRVLSAEELTSVSSYLTGKYIPASGLTLTLTIGPDPAAPGNYLISATTTPATPGLTLNLYKSNDLSLGKAGFTAAAGSSVDDGGGNYHFFPTRNPSSDGTQTFYLVK